MNIETHTGLYLDYEDPKVEQVCIEDIAHALSNVCRFGGHSKVFYSVAEHALLVRELVIEEGRPDLGLAALHHDSHEAYIGDVPTPLKAHLGQVYITLRRRIDVTIARWLDIPEFDFHDKAVTDADTRALRIEAGVLKSSRGVGPHWTYAYPMRRNGFMPLRDNRAIRNRFVRAHREEMQARENG